MSELELSEMKRRIGSLEIDLDELKRMLKDLKDELDSRFDEHEDDYLHQEKPIEYA